MTSNKIIKDFKNNGFVKVNCLNKKKLRNFKLQFAKLIEVSFKKNFPKKKLKFKKLSEKSSFYLDKGMILLEKKNHKNLSIIYDQIARSTCFFDIISDKKITSIINLLLERKKNTNLYVNSSTIRMDVPGLTKFVYGWHQDYKSNIKDSNFVQIWLPPINNIDKKLGGLHILKNSFMHDIRTTHNKVEVEKLKRNLPLRANYGIKLLSHKNKFKEKIITCNLGEVIFFNKWLMHKSGINKTKNKMRYVMSSFYHDMYNPNWKFVSLNHKSA